MCWTQVFRDATPGVVSVCCGQVNMFSICSSNVTLFITFQVAFAISLVSMMSMRELFCDLFCPPGSSRLCKLYNLSNAVHFCLLCDMSSQVPWTSSGWKTSKWGRWLTAFIGKWFWRSTACYSTFWPGPRWFGLAQDSECSCNRKGNRFVTVPTLGWLQVGRRYTRYHKVRISMTWGVAAIFNSSIIFAGRPPKFLSLFQSDPWSRKSFVNPEIVSNAWKSLQNIVSEYVGHVDLCLFRFHRASRYDRYAPNFLKQIVTLQCTAQGLGPNACGDESWRRTMCDGVCFFWTVRVSTAGCLCWSMLILVPCFSMFQSLVAICD